MAAKAWALTGNSLGTPPQGVLGTTDNNALVIETNGTERLRVDTSGNVGIGTNSPTAGLHLAPGKALRIEGGASATDTTDYFSFGGWGTFGIDAPGVPNGRLVVQPSGNVGVGTANPVNTLDVSSSNGIKLGLEGNGGGQLRIGNNRNDDKIFMEAWNAAGNGSATELLLTGQFGQSVPQISLFADTLNVSSKGIVLGIQGNGGGQLRIGNNLNDDKIFMEAWNAAGNGSATELLLTGASGQSVPQLTLLATTTNISGDVAVAGDVLLTGADCAEEFDVVSRQLPDPGTVMVIDTNGALRESADAYDRRVAGVVSGGGDYKHALVLDKQSSNESRVPLALVGKVYCKVDASYSPIAVGDLLTTSPTPGHAMKAGEPLKAFGCVIGKALAPLARGQGLLPVLVALQ